MESFANKNRLPGFSRYLAAILVGWLAIAHAHAFSIQDLMQQMGQHKQGEARFAETKYMAILDRPVKSSGTLAFQAPSRIEKNTLEPTPENMLLDGDTLTLVRGGKKRVIQLSSYPQALAFVDSIRGLLLGDFHLLETGYKIQVTGSAENWRLLLLPREQRLAEVIKQIKMSGSYGKLSTIEYIQSDGDYSVMKIDQPAADPASLSN